MNSERMPNTLTNTLESIGGVPEPPAATKGSKTGFWRFSLPLPLACTMQRRTSNEVCKSRNFQLFFEFREQNALAGARMNSEHTPNTPTNMLESTGVVPVTSAATYVAKSQFSPNLSAHRA